MSFLPKFLTGRPKGLKPESWDEITTSDQFQRHVKSELGGWRHIQPHERECFELATAQYGIKKNGTHSWGEHDIDKFLASRLPSKLRSDVQTARPLLYRCMARMGSYPYLEEPDQPGVLTVDDMLAALSIILLRPSWLGRPDNMVRVDATVAETHARKFRALLFRSMRLPQKSTDKSHEVAPDHPRCEEDNEDLRQVHLLLTKSRRYQSERWATKLKSGPPIIAIQDLPSSNSTDVTGSVPLDELESFIRICAFLESGGQDVKQKADITPSPRGVDWEEFDAIIASAPVVSLERLPMHLVSEIGNQSSLIRGMTLLFSLFISPVENPGTVGEQKAS